MPRRRERIAELRTKAARARELAETVDDERAAANLFSYARDLNEEADRIAVELQKIIEGQSREKPN